MPKITEAPTFHDGVYQLATTDPVKGGDPAFEGGDPANDATDGQLNAPLKHLADRTRWLKDFVDGLGEFKANAPIYAGNLDSLLTGGGYQVTMQATNTPDDGNNFFVLVIAQDGVEGTFQLAYHIVNETLHFRGRNDTWGEWHRLGLHDDAPVGVVRTSFSSVLGDKWLICDGRTVSRTEFSELFALIGTAYSAGDGSTTFGVPDYTASPPVGDANLLYYMKAKP